MDRKNVEDLYPLSPMQQGMLFHSLLAPESGVYFEQVSCRLTGELDGDAFERAWREVVARHPVLRTGFVGEGLKEQVQVVHRAVTLPFAREDWRGLPSFVQRARLDAWLEDERRRGFDLARPPLMRLALLRTGDHAHQLVWCYHHALLDGWSVPMLLQDVFALYEGFRRGRPPALGPRRPYRDYIVWLRKQDLARARAFWTEALAGITAATPLVVDAPEPAGAGQCFEDAEVELEEADTRRLLALARQHGVTPSTLVQGAWALLLARYSGEERVVFGTTVSGRPPDLDGVEAMLGLFINTLPMCVQVDEDAPVTGWLRSLQARAAEMRQFEYSPLVQVQGWSAVPRGHPLFESILVFENYPMQEALAGAGQGGGLAVDDLRSAEYTNYPLTVVAGVEGRLVLRIIHDAARFDGATVARMLGHLRTLLEGMAANPERRLRDLPLLTAAERTEILDAFNAHAALAEPVQLGHRMFQAAARRSPDAEAVVCRDERLTYRELEARANRLAQHLVARGVRPGSAVAVFLHPSVDFVTAILAVLGAGAAWVPLDPGYPAERLAFMLEDSGARHLVTASDLADRLPAHGAELVLLDREAAEIAAREPRDPDAAVGPDSPAYVIYTSGSTGRPKGAVNHHRGLCNVGRAFVYTLEAHERDRVLQLASFSFDASVVDMFSALGGGAALHVVPLEVRGSLEDLRELIRSQRITVAVLPPAVLAVLSPDDYPDLRCVMSAGEACPPEVAARWARGRSFFNGYGPTETAVCSSIHAVEGELPAGATRVPIGHPLPNTRSYVLDRLLRPLPVGVPGELCIGGVGVGHGYLNRPELTAEKFLPDPFAPGGRLYRTGDRARWLPDGTLDYLGRRDDQVMVRGYRIELGEIEAVLREQAGVQDAAAMVREDQPGDRRLVAYVAGRPGTTPAAAALADALRQRLPHYMIPAAFVVLERLPLSANGKVDRRALPAPGTAASHATTGFLAPRDAWEEKLVPIWEAVLEVKPVGVRDDFFAIGGDSLRAVRLMARIEQDLGRKLPLARLFEEPTVEHLAQLLRVGGEGSTLVPLRAGGTRAPLFFVHPSGGSVHWYVELAKHLAPEQPFYAVQAQGVDGTGDIHTRIEEMAAHYVRAVRERQPKGPYRLGSWSMGVMIAFEMAQQLRAAGEEVSLLALVDQGPRVPLAAPADHAEYLVQTYGEHVPLSLDRLRELAPEDQVAHVWERARQEKWITLDVPLDAFRAFVHMLRTHTEAWRGYEVRPYPGRITVFRARKQPAHAPPEPDLGWAAYARDGVAVRDVPGDHMTVMLTRHVKALARQLQACLDETEPPAAAEASP